MHWNTRDHHQHCSLVNLNKRLKIYELLRNSQWRWQSCDFVLLNLQCKWCRNVREIDVYQIELLLKLQCKCPTIQIRPETVIDQNVEGMIKQCLFVQGHISIFPLALPGYINVMHKKAFVCSLSRPDVSLMMVVCVEKNLLGCQIFLLQCPGWPLRWTVSKHPYA